MTLPAAYISFNDSYVPWERVHRQLVDYAGLLGSSASFGAGVDIDSAQTVGRLSAPSSYEIVDSSPQKSDWLNRFQRAASRFALLERGWDSAAAEPVSSLAAIEAAAQLEELWERGVRPSRIAPTIERGIAISFFSETGHAVLEVLEDGSLLTDLPTPQGHIVNEVATDVDLEGFFEAVQTIGASKSASENAASIARAGGVQ